MYRQITTTVRYSNWRFVAIGAFIGLVMLAQISRLEFDRYAENYPRLIPVKQHLRHAFRCYEDAMFDHKLNFDNKTWFALPDMAQKCAGSLLPLLNLQEFKSNSSDHVLYYVPSQSGNSKYNMTTVGIGHDVDAERAIMKKYLNYDRFIGVDADPEVNKDLVKSIGGQFISFLISPVEDGYLKMFKNIGNVPSTSPTRLSKVFEATDMEFAVDVLNLNLEGGEGLIFWEITSRVGKYPELCQFNIKFNYPPTLSHQIFWALYQAAVGGRYLLIKCVQSQSGLINRCFFLNVEDAYCAEKYAKVLLH